MSKPKVHGIGKGEAHFGSVSSRRTTMCRVYFADQVSVTNIDFHITCGHCLNTFAVRPVNPLPEIRAHVHQCEVMVKQLGYIPAGHQLMLIENANKLLKLLGPPKHGS